MNLWLLGVGALAAFVYSAISKHGGLDAWCEAMAEQRWKASCNGMRLESARLTWLGRRANRLGWLDSSVLADARRAEARWGG